MLAAVGLASCVQTEELAVANNNTAIAFDTFVDNVTKTIYDNSNLTYFNVYGTITADNGGVITNIFPGVEVSNATGVWAYDSQYTQYWIPGFTYKFAAVVGAKNDKAVVGLDANGMPATITTDMANQEDILYATVSRHFGANDTAAKVEFQFAHLLSKAKFTVKNSITAGTGFVYNVESVKITNADASAVYNVADGAWTGTGDYDADFEVNTAIAQDANTVSKDVLLVPGTKELTIAIKYNLTYNSTELVNTTKNLTAALTLEQGKAYNFIVEFGAPGEDIKFDAQVKDWVDGGNVTPGTSYVATAEEFITAFAAEGIDRIVLADDIVLTTGATRAAGPSFVLNNGKELTINLGGKTLTANFTPADESAAVFDVRGTLNVENGTVIINREDAAFSPSYRTCVFCTSFNGVVNLNGVTAKNNGGAGMAYVLDMSNATNAAYNVDNSTLESTYIAVRIFNNMENGVHNATIKNSILKGKYCFWVQYYLADGRSQEVLDRQLKLDIYNNNNTFEPAEGKLPILFGYNSYVSANGNGITKSVSEDGTVVTLGSLVENGVVGRYVAGDENNTIKKVVVGEGITTLENRVFRKFHALEEVILPNGLTTIGVAGKGSDDTTGTAIFQGCESLKSIVIPETVTAIDKGAFYGCSALESINIPAGVTRIEESSLRATAIKNIEFHEGVTYFGKWAFRDCEVLEQIVINAPSFTVEADTFTNMAVPYPNFTIYVANAEMKTYLEGMLDAEEKKYITVVAPSTVSTAEEFSNALSAGGSISLQEDIDVTKIDLTTLANDVIIDANGKTITTASNYGVQVKAGKNITLKNAKVEITVAGDYITYAAGLKIENGDYQGNTITLKDCEIRMCNDDWAYAVNMPASVKNLNLVIDGCTLEGAIALQCWGDNNTITATNSHFICNYKTNAMYTSYCVVLQGDGTYKAENNTLNIRGCEFSYSGVDNFNSVIKAVSDVSGAGNNTITVVDCTYNNKVTAY